MFMGEFQHNIDAKGRIIVPSKFRDELGTTFVVTRGLARCLLAYPMNEWKQLEEKLKQLPVRKKDARALTRFFFSGAVECEVDKQGRVNIPQPLRTYASFRKECVISGVSNRIELWSSANWGAYFNEAEESFADIAETLLDFDMYHCV